MSARDHTQIEELLAVRALGGLEPDELAELDVAMATHGPDCAECRRLQVGFEETAAMLAFSLEPTEVPDDAADRLLDVARADALPHAPAATDELAVRRTQPGRGRAWRAVVGIAAAFALVVLGVALIRTPGPQDVSSNWAQTVVAFEGEGELAMAYAPGTSGVVLWGEGLPDPGPGNVYELWMIDDDVPISGGCLTPVDGRLAAFVDADVGAAELMAMTVESEACPGAPTSEPVQVATLV